ncbi:MAG TPA: twin-arginine translocase subunit TatC [Nocardioidaceae bacterium]|jgi:sec-independent protein translocase protein TatC|nr:twin-arginine translocase subunit TatC [Nocardioidaceae bacterium]
MSVAGVIGLFRANPQSPVGDDGRMALVDHLRELRARLLRSVLVLVVALIVALFFYNQLLDIVYYPYGIAKEQLKGKVDTVATINGAGGPLLLQLKLCGVAAVVATAPYWLYQVWAFILPGLHPHERRATRVFALVAGPLFLAGVGVGYYVLPKGLTVLIGFAGPKLQSLVDFGEYFSFFSRMLLVFGVSFEIPVFVVLLNLAGVLPGRTLGKYRPWIVVGTFVFAAVATPSTDPFSMLMLAIPMTVLFLVSEVIARLVDRRRRRAAPYAGLDDDEASGLDDPDVVLRSDLDDED